MNYPKHKKGKMIFSHCFKGVIYFKGVKKGGDMHICMSDSFCCTQMNTAL